MLALALLAGAPAIRAAATDEGNDGAEALWLAYAREVDRRQDLPEAEREAYARRLADALAPAGLPDPALERRLGEVRSKGCIRIPASLNRFLDRRGLLDADYEGAVARGARLWVLGADRQVVRWPGRYLVVVDSGRPARPAWSPAPRP